MCPNKRLTFPVFKEPAMRRDAGMTAFEAVVLAFIIVAVLGLLFHGAEHCTRHAGQIITTAKVVRQG